MFNKINETFSKEISQNFIQKRFESFGGIARIDEQKREKGFCKSVPIIERSQN